MRQVIKGSLAARLLLACGLAAPASETLAASTGHRLVYQLDSSQLSKLAEELKEMIDDSNTSPTDRHELHYLLVELDTCASALVLARNGNAEVLGYFNPTDFALFHQHSHRAVTGRRLTQDHLEWLRRSAVS